MELADFCDMRQCRDGARFGVPIARLGATLANPELVGLMRLVSPAAALELLIEGQIIGAHEAAAKGVVDRVIPANNFDDEVRKTIVRTVAGAPLAAQWQKEFVERLRSVAPLTEAELAEGYACYDTDDYKIGYETFLNKRPPLVIEK